VVASVGEICESRQQQQQQQQYSLAEGAEVSLKGWVAMGLMKHMAVRRFGSAIWCSAIWFIGIVWQFGLLGGWRVGGWEGGRVEGGGWRVEGVLVRGN
jgi:hypothetical protein